MDVDFGGVSCGAKFNFLPTHFPLINKSKSSEVDIRISWFELSPLLVVAAPWRWILVEQESVVQNTGCRHLTHIWSVLLSDFSARIVCDYKCPVGD